MSKKLTYDYICTYCGEDCQKIRALVVTASNVKNNVGWVQTKRGKVQYFHNSCFKANTLKRNKET